MARDDFIFFDQERLLLLANQSVSAQLSGSLVPIALESSITAGGGTIVIDLSGDSYVATFTDAVKQAILDGLTASSTAPNGWNNEVRDQQPTSAVIRTGATRATITLVAAGGYQIDADEVVTVTIPATAVLGANAIVADPTLTILALIEAPEVTPPTDAEIADALSGRAGPIVQRFLYEWRDHNYVLLGDLSSAVEPGGFLDMDNTRATPLIGSLELRPTLLPAGFDPQDDHVAIAMQVRVNGAFVTFPLALMHLDVARKVTRPDPESGGNNQFLRVDMSDLSIHLQGKTSEPYVIAAGTNYMDAVRTILDLLGLAHNLPSTTQVLPVPMTFGPSTHWREIVDELTLSINHFPIWPGAQGVVVTRERIDPANETEVVSYDTTTEPRMIIDEVQQHDEHGRFDNRAVVLIDHPARTPEWALRLNDDPSSPVAALDAESVRSEKIDGPYVFDKAMAGAIAQYHVLDQATRAEQVDVRTLVDPRRGVRDFYRLTIETVVAGVLYQVATWRMDLTPGSSMDHTVGRARALTLTAESSA